MHAMVDPEQQIISTNPKKSIYPESTRDYSISHKCSQYPMYMYNKLIQVTV